MSSSILRHWDAPGESRQAGVSAAVITGNLVGNVSLYVLPMLGGSLCKRFHITDDIFGLIVSAQLAGMGVSPLVLAGLPRLKQRALPILMLGLSCILLGVTLSAAAITVSQLMMLRALAGAGEGMVLAVTYRVIVNAGFAPRRFSVIQIINGVCIIGVFYLVPPIVNRFGTEGVFLSMAALTLSLAPWVMRLARADLLQEAGRAGQGGRSSFGLSALALLGGWAVFQISQNGLWAYAERIGANSGFTLENVASAAIIGTVAYTAAPFLVLIIGKRLGWSLPLATGCALTGICCAALPYAGTLWLYVVEFSIFCFAMNLAMPYANALAAELDPSGRLVTAMPGSFAIGSMIGPTVAGLAFKVFESYGAVGWVTGIVIFPSAALLVHAALSAKSS